MNDIYVDEQELQDLLTEEQERIERLTHASIEEHDWKPFPVGAYGTFTLIETINVEGSVIASVECCLPCRILRNKRRS